MKQQDWRKTPFAVWLAMGVAVGAGMGSATGDMGFWLGVGAAIGVALGYWYARPGQGGNDGKG